MRITGGTLSRREIRVPKGIRPTQDKVRAALFNSLGEFVVGARVLELFAGSGALGIEAWSRGADLVCWIESNRNVFRTLQDNVRALCAGEGGRTECRLADVAVFLRKGWTGEPFTLILCDPPYGEGWLERILPAVEEGGTLACGGLLVFEQGAMEPVIERPGWGMLREKRYGDTRLVMYRRKEGAS